MTPLSSEVTAGTNATSDQYNNLRKDVMRGLKINTSVADGGTINFDLSLGNVFKATLAGNRILSLSNEVTDQVFTVSLTQDATGSRTVTWFSTIRWIGGVTPTLTTTANKRDVFGFIVTGSGTYDGFVIGQNL